MALHLSLQRELSHGEIANIMECPLGTVKSYILRGQERLKLLMVGWNSAE